MEHQLEENAMIQVNNTRFQFLSGENSTNNIMKIPENKNDPVDILNLTIGEEMAFPWLLPEGKFGYKFERPIKITLSMHFRTRLYNKSAVFRKKYYLFVTFSCFI